MNMQYVIKGLIILVACAIDMRKYLVRDLTGTTYKGYTTDNAGCNSITLIVQTSVGGIGTDTGGLDETCQTVHSTCQSMHQNGSTHYVNINMNMQYVIKGLIILVACAIDMRKYLVRK